MEEEFAGAVKKDVVHAPQGSSIDGNLAENPIVVLTRAMKFIAAHILRDLLNENYTVHATFDHHDKNDDIDVLFDISSAAHTRLHLFEVDIQKPDHWKDVMQNAKYVIHVVRSTSTAKVGKGKEAVSTAINGVRNVLEACLAAKTVQRIILITSVSTIVSRAFQRDSMTPYTEEDWEEEQKVTNTFAKGQIVAEKMAWNIINSLTESDKIQLVVLNPAFVFGPILAGGQCSSMTLIKHLLEGTIPVLPNINIPLIDVRDVAQATLKSLTVDTAVGHRHILCGHYVWVSEVSDILDEEFRTQGYKVSKRTKRFCLPMWTSFRLEEKYKILENNTFCFDTTRMQTALGVEPRCIKETILDSAYSLIHWNKVKKPGTKSTSYNCFKCC